MPHPKVNIKKIGLVLFLLCMSLFLTAANAQTVNSYTFHTIDTRDGLSNNSINKMLVDSRGYLWVGTSLGLNRYDGYSVRNYYNYNMQRHLPVINVTDLQEDALGNIWVESEIPVVRYNFRTDRFDTENQEYLRSLGFTVPEKFKVKVDAEGSLWLISNGMLQYLSLDAKAEGKVKQWKVDMHMSYAYDIYAEDFAHNLYLTDGTSIWHFNARSGQSRKLTVPAPLNSNDRQLRIYIDLEGLLWIYSTVSEEMVCYSQPALCSGLPGSASATNAIRDIYEDGQNQLWIATDHRGLFIYNKQTKQWHNYLHSDSDATSLSSNNVTCLLSDHQGTLWVGHLNTGISYSNPKYNLFTFGKHAGADVSTMLFDRHGNLWLGTDGNGLFIEKTDGSQVRAPLPSVTISSLLEDKDGSMWVGTYNNGLYHLVDGGVKAVYTSQKGQLPNNSVWQMANGNDGRIWYTSVFGKLAYFDKAAGRGAEYNDNGGKVSGASVTTDGSGRIYCGTYYGIWIYDTNTGKSHYALGNKAGTQKFLQMVVGPMHFDRRHELLWLGHNSGISVWDLRKDSIYYLDNTNGLLDINIKGIESDSHGYVWVGTGKGVSCIQTMKNETGGTSFFVRNFTSREGIQNRYFNTYAVAKDSEGEVLFGGDGGYTRVSTALLCSDAEHPKPYFAEVMVGDSILPIPENGEWGLTSVRLNYDDRQIKVHLFTGNLISSNRVMYAYRLRGVSDEWIYTEDNVISFFSLAHGKYTLEVKASGEDGKWGEVSKLTIHVAPPFYLSWWMNVVYCLVVIVFLYLAYRLIMSRQERHMEQEKMKMEQEQIMRLSEMKLRFFTNISHDLRTPLTLIISPLQSILRESLPEGLRGKLEVIEKNAQLLLNQVSMLLDFRRLDVGAESLKLQSQDIVHYVSDACLSFHDYAEERHIRFAFKTDLEQLFMEFDAEKLNKILYNLLSNAFKFTPDEGCISVSLAQKADRVVISVADSGQGISDTDKQAIFQRFYQVRTDDPKAGSGIGLHIVKEYVCLHGGEVSVRDNVPAGSIFEVALPLHNEQKAATAGSEKSTATASSIAGSTAITEEKQDKTQTFTLLVVDDNPDMCRFVADSFRDRYEVITACDGEDALQKLQGCDVSLVVSDVMMPKIDGMELCRRIKTDLRWSHIPVILLTAKSAEQSMIEGLQLGADDYITKPFNIEHLALRIQKFIEWTQQSHATFQQKVEIEPSEITITPLDEEFVKDAVRVVENHMADSDFSVEAFGKEVGMSRAHLYKKLMVITGKGPHEFIRTIRMKRAYQLLEKSQKQISEVAYEVGYNSPKRFSENFKQEYGMTPSEFLKSRKQ